MEKRILENILGRPLHADLLNNETLTNLKDATILVTGANGSIGKRFIERMGNYANIIATDVDTLDVTDINDCIEYSKYNPDYVINLAGAKHAPKGEHETIETLNINTLGTYHILNTFKNSKIILTSTCKSCNPETVYGATKLIAERMTINRGGVVARFYNVVETQGNVFELWEQQNPKEVAVFCERYFISLDEAVGLLIYCLTQESGRYSVNPKEIRNMQKVYESIYGTEPYKVIPQRRGDRITEKLCSTSERIKESESILKIESWHD